MEFGIVLQTDPPGMETVRMAKLAEEAGFACVWTFDSVVLWQEPFVIYSAILAATNSLRVGTMVTNPLTRDPTVTASLFATLNEMYGSRTICGIGRGDSAVRVTGGKPASLARLIETVGVVKELAEGRAVTYRGQRVQLPWVTSGTLPVWMAAYGPRALEAVGRYADGLILQLGDPFLAKWSIAAVRDAAVAAGRDPGEVRICVAAPAYVGEDMAHMREQVRWFGGMVGNHVADLVTRYGAESGAVPAALTEYIKGRQGYDYSHHGKAGNPSTDFVPDAVVDRFCVLGPVEAHKERLAELAGLGVDHFAVYLMHDAKEATLAAYGEEIIPQLDGSSTPGTVRDSTGSPTRLAER
ncbi:MAG: TIGR03842 family LLM class F420-dependent oxidoreductase [Acidimicrobiales bacterium]